MTERSWEVEPGSGVGPLRFGATRGELRELLGPHEAFRRGATSELTDQYEDGLIMLTCSDREGLHLIEIPKPDGLYYHGVHLGGAAETVLGDLRAAGIEATADDSGWLLAGGALALYATGDRIEAVTAFGPGHEMRGEIVFFPAGAEAMPPASSYVVTPGSGAGPVALGGHRDEVRNRLSGGLCWQHAPGSREPVEDTFMADGLTVRYGAGHTAERIFVTRADEVRLDGINLMPAHPATIEDVQASLVGAGYSLIEREAAIEIAGAGVEIRTTRPSPSGAGRMPVACVSVSADSPEALY
ncbi:hypothetical protein [Paractinoplanes lichenicola]|uniref:VOC domain-containing protein n=1 Tax=Paractinoplanes lichenicola TaxID=2802976 RepID=A0ABS1VY70_9ACTN|nr:hypothetical protein [Actinoplanes lichenicola]MBL7259389.1 hypothetical protein [Actinoplanes lichenicola]